MARTDSSAKSGSMLLRAAITGIHGCVSSFSAYKELPISLIRGLEKESIILAFVGAAVGTLIAASLIRHQLRVAILFGILVVFAVFYYEKVLSGGGVELYQMLLALICYTYLFVALVYLITLLEHKVLGF